MKKFFLTLLGCIFIFGIAIFFMGQKGVFIPFVPTPDIALTASTGAMDFLNKAKEQIGVVKAYDRGNGYYGNGGFPPPDTGVCSDVIWRAYRDMGYDFRALVQADIKKNPIPYDGDMDSNINYRRVKRLFVYFNHTTKVFTNTLTPGDIKNLEEWQPGDIVIFDELPSNHLWHIGIIADTRNSEGVPYMIDNHGLGVGITMTPLDWPTRIIGHYRPF